MTNFSYNNSVFLLCILVTSHLLPGSNTVAISSQNQAVNSSSRASPASVIQLCGFRSNDLPQLGVNRIVGGSVAEKNEFTWQISIQWAYKDSKYHVCGASIIGQQWVLTAAHCTRDFRVETLVFVAGDYRMKTDEGTEQTRRAIKVIEHERYDPVTQENDITIVKMESPFIFDPLTVAPVCLPASQETFTGSCVVSGWGKLREGGTNSDVLQKVWLPIITDIECAQKMKSIGYKGPVKETMICAGFPEGGQDACQGDSGGPFVCQGKGNLPVLVGVVSWGIGCARKNIPGVYTEVSKYVDWINSKIAANTQTPSILIPRPVGDNIIFWEQHRKGANKGSIRGDNDEEDEETESNKDDDNTTDKNTTTGISNGVTASPIKGFIDESLHEAIWGDRDSYGSLPGGNIVGPNLFQTNPTGNIPQNYGFGLVPANNYGSVSLSPSLQRYPLVRGPLIGTNWFQPAASLTTTNQNLALNYPGATEFMEAIETIRGISKVPSNMNLETLWGSPGINYQGVVSPPLSIPAPSPQVQGNWFRSSEERSKESLESSNPYFFLSRESSEESRER